MAERFTNPVEKPVSEPSRLPDRPKEPVGEVQKPHNTLKSLLENVMVEARALENSPEVATFVLHVQNAVRQLEVIELAAVTADKS